MRARERVPTLHGSCAFLGKPVPRGLSLLICTEGGPSTVEGHAVVSQQMLVPPPTPTPFTGDGSQAPWA